MALARLLAQADTRVLAKAVRVLLVMIVLAAATLLVVTGRLGLALAAASFLLPAFVRWRTAARRERAARGASPDGETGVETAWLAMRLE
ncbi:MAG: hypothetical protein LAT81_16800, partial [Oceanicaulis sp.]|nr:hypothetical protein [Oceanicaulis sp.]